MTILRKPWLFIVILWLLLSHSLFAAESIRIGILAYHLKAETQVKWSSLKPALEQALPGQSFNIDVYTLNELEKFVASRKLDFILTTPSQFLLLSHRYGLSAPLLSLSNIEQGKPVSSFGGVIFTRSTRGDIQDLKDLRNKSVAAVSTLSFGGYQMQAYELQQAGYVLPIDIDLLITDYPQNNVIDAVLNGKADVGFVRTGVLENLSQTGKLDLAQIKIINQQNLPGFPVISSTQLYPEWILASLPHTDKTLNRKVTAYLLTLADNKPLVQKLGINGFEVPQDYTSVENMLRELKMPPFDVISDFTLGDIWQRYRWLIITGLLIASILLLLFLRLLLANRRLNDSQNMLQALINSSEVGIAWANDRGVIEYANAKFSAMFGYTLHDVPTVEHWYQHAYPDHSYRNLVITEWEQNIANSLLAKSPLVPMEVKVNCKNGAVRNIVIYGSWAGTRLVALFTDITERKQAQDMLAKQERHLRAVLEATTECVKLVSKDGILQSMNPAGLKILEVVEPECVLGQSILSVIAPENHNDFIAFNNEVCAGKSGTLQYEIITLKGNRRWVEARAVPFRLDDSDEIAQLAFTRDITERRNWEQALTDSELRFRELFNLIPDAVFVSSLDSQFNDVNQAACQKLGYSHEELLQMSPAHIDLPEFGSKVPDRLRILKTQGQHKFESAHVHKDGTVIPVEINACKVTLGDSQLILAVAIDLTERKQAEAKLRLTSNVFEYTVEGIMITNANWELIEVNPAFTQITGYNREEVLGKNPRILKSGHQDKAFYQAMWQAINTTGHWSGEIWNRRKNGEIYPEWITISAIFNEAKEPTHYVGISSDITLLKQHEKQLERIAHYDALTGIPNRVLLVDRMQQALAQTRREQKQLAICYLDLDGFKPINDSLGHESGDKVLIKIAERISSILRGGDTVARLGGDEFVILLLGINSVEECRITLKRLLETIEHPITVSGLPYQVTASIGVTLFPLDNEDPDTLLRHADQAMYLAKQSGKNRYYIFDPSHDARIKINLEFRSRIEQGLASGEFELFYQPKVDMIERRITGAEALIRWQHPEKGLLPPIEFLPVIENSELEIIVGEWVIDTALRQINEWCHHGKHLEVSINIAAAHLQSPNFIKHLSLKLTEYSLVKSNLLQIEILETAALADIASISEIIETCSTMGVSFALDDFGTGYSSLAYLRRLPADTLKIDQSFVRDMLTDPNDFAIVQGIIALAQTFHRITVAEGVETEAHFQALMNMGCNLGQGYGIARPMPAATFIQWLDQAGFKQ